MAWPSGPERERLERFPAEIVLRISVRASR